MFVSVTKLKKLVVKLASVPQFRRFIFEPARSKSEASELIK